MVFMQTRRFDDAIGDFTRAIELDPQNVKAYVMRAEARLQGGTPDETQSNVYAALNDVNQALGVTPNDPLALRVRGNVYEALHPHQTRRLPTTATALAQDPFQIESREALVRLDQEVPPEPGQPLGEPVAGWVVREPSPGRYVASNPKYPSLRAELEMFGAGTAQDPGMEAVEGCALAASAS